ncbi:hypothetical protein F5X99DRAFT_431090 [Biscogniauxia marginata]|nr:hypothetical protein F5X99DRAFT_431090 [Biscogniauxia marginata]
MQEQKQEQGQVSLEEENPVYLTQRPHLQRTFRGKLPRIREQHAQFWAAGSGAAADVQAYLRGDAEHRYATGLPKWIAASTPFTRWAGPTFASSPSALLIGNRASFDAAQYHSGPSAAGMSMVHLLCIPRAGIFNGVALDEASVGIVDEMAALFREAWARPEVRVAVVRHQLAAIECRQRQVPDEAAYVTALGHWEELRRMVLDEDALGVDDFQFGLHLWPDHSVGHLHMHILAAPLAYRKYSTSHHDEKTKDVFEVRDYIKSLFPRDA